MPTPTASWNGKDERNPADMLQVNGWTKILTDRVGEVWVAKGANVWIRHEEEGWFSFKTERPHRISQGVQELLHNYRLNAEAEEISRQHRENPDWERMRYAEGTAYADHWFDGES